MNPEDKQYLDARYATILGALSGSLIGMVDIDIHNPVEVAVAAYYLGWQECLLDRAQKEL